VTSSANRCGATREVLCRSGIAPQNVARTDCSEVGSPMDDTFAQALAEWSTFYALMGGASATLLGLLFVAVSVRLNIFHQRQVADVRDFAAFTFGTFLVAIGVAGIAVAPHAHRSTLALSLLLVSIAAISGIAVVARVWISLNVPATGRRPGYGPAEWRGWVYMLVLSPPYIGLIAVVALLWRSHPDALGLLAFVEGWLLVMGTVAAWVMLSHAGSAPTSGDTGDTTGG
jgi:hypothetical protein